jgi:2-methylaconitate cis-trans-isomerase PrpF
MNPSPDREEALFRAAAELESRAARAAFLDQACAGNRTLRARLDALLAAHEQTEGALAEPPPAANATMKIEFTDAPDEAVGQTLGRYKLLERVGEGGCGTVYVAEQTEPVRRRVALKVIKLGMDTKQVVARFEAEQQALAQMDQSY